MNKRPAKRLILYSVLVFFLAADYMSLPSGLEILDGLKRSGHLDLLFPLIYASILVLSIIAVRGRPASLGLKRSMFVTVAILLSALYFMKLEEPNLKAHFLEYELITILLFKALELDLRKMIIYPLTIAGVTLIGITEEVVQALYPTRTFDLQDLKIDFFSALMMIVIIYLFKNPSYTNKTA